MSTAEELPINDADPVEGVGNRLRAAREAQSLSVSDVAQALKISPRQVELLEGNAWNQLPGYTFVRGFVRNYARFLRLDVEALIKALDASAAPPPPALNLPSNTRVELPKQGQVQRRDFITMIVAAGLVVIAVLVFLLPEGWLGSTAANLITKAPEPAVANPTVASAPASTPGPLFPPAGAQEPGMPVLQPAMVAIEAVSGTVPQPVAEPEQQVVQAAVPSVSVPGSVTAEFGVNQLSWIEVKDKTGAILLSENLAAGTRRMVTGVPPLAVVVGNAGGVQLTVNGKLVELQQRTRNSVARLTLE